MRVLSLPVCCGGGGAEASAATGPRHVRGEGGTPRCRGPEGLSHRRHNSRGRGVPAAGAAPTRAPANPVVPVADFRSEAGRLAAVHGGQACPRRGGEVRGDPLPAGLGPSDLPAPRGAPRARGSSSASEPTNKVDTDAVTDCESGEARVPDEVVEGRRVTRGPGEADGRSVTRSPDEVVDGHRFIRGIGEVVDGRRLTRSPGEVVDGRRLTHGLGEVAGGRRLTCRPVGRANGIGRWIYGTGFVDCGAALGGSQDSMVEGSFAARPAAAAPQMPALQGARDRRPGALAHVPVPALLLRPLLCDLA